MRQDIEFDADGTTLRGWLYVPHGATGPAPTIVMSHGGHANARRLIRSDLIRPT